MATLAKIGLFSWQDLLTPPHSAAMSNYCDVSRRPGVKCQMSYLSYVVNQRPILRVSGEIVLAFCCAAPLVLLVSSLVAYGVRSFLQ